MKTFSNLAGFDQWCKEQRITRGAGGLLRLEQQRARLRLLRVSHFWLWIIIIVRTSGIVAHCRQVTNLKQNQNNYQVH